ncbi:MAG: peptidylprolyl isomerase [Anaerolineales bacterium]|nr:peptidylprolyl isomerase [Anaerolineales bacterium]
MKQSLFKITSVLLLSALLFSACQQASPAPQTEIPATVSTPGHGELPEGMEMLNDLLSEPAECTAVSSGELVDYAMEGDHIYGATEGYLTTVTAYTDFQCTECALMKETLDKLIVDYPDQVRVIIRNFPIMGSLSLESTAMLAIDAAENQGMGEDVYNMLVATQAEWLALTTDEFLAWLPDNIQTVEGLDIDQFNEEYNPPHANDKAGPAMQAAEAADQQGKYWEVYNLLFDYQADWKDLTPEEFTTWIIDQAGQLGLDADQFNADMNNEEAIAAAELAWNNGLESGYDGVPYVLVDNSPLPVDYYDYEIFKSLLGSTIIPLNEIVAKQFTECPPMMVDPSKSYSAILQTNLGDVTLSLYPEVAPMAVNSFVFLAENDWFDNTIFHRVEPGFVAQGGDPSGTGYGNPGYLFETETDPNLNFDRAGLLAMANSGPTSNGSQFFITYGAAEHLNGGYTIFGEVIDGMDVVNTFQDIFGKQDIVIEDVEIIIK